MPLSAVFQNGPNWGKDVFIPIDWIIGGKAQVGNGWRMLMESLAAGRGISLPSSSHRHGQARRARDRRLCARASRSSRRPIGKFEGVEEALARMGGNLYVMDAMRMLDCARQSILAKSRRCFRASPSITSPSAADRSSTTPWTSLAARVSAWVRRIFSAPHTCKCRSSITVEGANILTRSLIVFGQGAIRCHPLCLQEIEATRD